MSVKRRRLESGAASASVAETDGDIPRAESRKLPAACSACRKQKVLPTLHVHIFFSFLIVIRYDANCKMKSRPVLDAVEGAWSVSCTNHYAWAMPTSGTPLFKLALDVDDTDSTSKATRNDAI